MTIRPENPGDRAQVRAVNEAAFPSREEADLVEALHREGAVLLSLVAEVEGRIAGHILFSRMWIDKGRTSLPAVALAPMAVVPAHQRQGIGSQLVHTGLAWLRDSGEGIVIVVGHPAYYPRFGFSPELARALASPFPPEAFMAMELRPGALDGVRGAVRYARAFGI